MEVDIDNDTIHGSSKAPTEENNSEMSTEYERDRDLLKKIEEIIKPLCDTVQLTLEKKICSFDKSEFLKIYNPLSDQYFKFFPSLHLIIHIESGNMNIKLFFEHRRVLRETNVSSLASHLSIPEEYLGTVTLLSSFLSELCARKYDVCHGAFDEETFEGDFGQVDLRSVLIESGDNHIIYRARQCHLLISKGSTSCQACQDLRDRLDMESPGKQPDTNAEEEEGEGEVCDPLDLLEVSIFDEESENKPNSDDLTSFSEVKPTHTKPKISYKKLIMGAIEDSPEKMLKLNDIYEWILARYPGFSSNRTGFQNSIRHNLSLNKVFIKVDAPNHGGKGGFWTINPAQALLKSSKVPDRSHKSLVLKRLQPKAPLSVLKPRIVSCKSVFFDSRGNPEQEGEGKSVLEPEVTITTIPPTLSSLPGITVNIKNNPESPETIQAASVCSVLQSLQPIPVPPPVYQVDPRQFSKPTFSYKELIMISIFSDPTQAMCLHDIYMTIQKWFPYFQQKEIGVTWQNSIRHNLSLNKCFQRLNTYLPTKVSTQCLLTTHQLTCSTLQSLFINVYINFYLVAGRQLGVRCFRRDLEEVDVRCFQVDYDVQDQGRQQANLYI